MHLIMIKKSVSLLSKLTKLEGTNLRSPLAVPGFTLCVGKLSFSRVEPKLINTFLQCFFKNEPD